MPFLHKYQEHDFANGFQTHNSILDTVPYEPEVIFIGTYNHGWSWNQSDFFYGRGMYMWPAMANLFLHKKNILIKKRQANNDVPSKFEIFDICKAGKFVFADIVKGIKDNIQAIEKTENESVLVNGNEYIWKSYKDEPLDSMAKKGWVDDNVNSIVKYINETKSIKHVYFTFKSGAWVVDKMNDIKQLVRKDVSCSSIFTPTASGFRKNLTSPYNERVWSLTHCWVWNGLFHKNPVNKIGYGHLNHNWLIGNGVDPNDF